MAACGQQYVFGPFRLDPIEGLFRGSTPIPLRPKPLLLLTYLVQHPGRVLSTTTILADVWNETVVDARGLKAYVSQLRKVLDDDAAAPAYIETLPKRGYRFKSAVQVIAPAPPADAPAEAEHHTPARTVAAGREHLALEREIGAFVGRKLELSRLEELLQDALQGTGRLVFITGEAGIGKTTLVNEFVRRAVTAREAGRTKDATADAAPHEPDVLVARGRCVEQHGTSEAYLPFLDALGMLLGGPAGALVAAVLQGHAPTWCLQLPAEFASMGTIARLLRETIGATKDRMLRELGDALRVLTSEVAVVLLLEDLHWADTSSIDLLRHLSLRLSGQRLLIVATLRPEEVERMVHPLRNYRATIVARLPCEELRLGPLTAEELARYLDLRFAPNDFPPDLAHTLHGATDGHPLFLTSLVQFLVERGEIACMEGRWTLTRPLANADLEAPEDLRSIIRAQIDALGEADRRALQYASVQGREFLSTVVAHSCGLDELTLEERLQQLERVHGLVEAVSEEELPDGTITMRYRFRHSLHQNVLFDDLVSGRRALLHREAGEQLLQHYGSEAGRMAALLAMHFEQGRDFVRAADYRIRMGDNAAGTFANAEAEQQYTKALLLAARLDPDDRGPRELSIYHRRGIVNLNLSRFDQALADFLRMREVAANRHDATSEAAALNEVTRTLFYLHRLEDMTHAADEALQVAERSGNPIVQLETMTLVGLRRLGYGELRGTAQLLDEAIETARRINSPASLCAALAWRGALHYWQSEYGKADRVLTEARELAMALQDGFLLLFSLFIQGLARGNEGRISDGLDCLEEASGIAERNGDQFWSARLPNCIGWIYREIQDFDRAIAYDRRGLDVGGARHVIEAEANALINLGVDYTEQGQQPEEALSVLRQVEELLAHDAWFKWRYSIRLEAASAEHWLRARSLDRATDHADRLDAMARDYGAWKYVTVADFLRARIAVARGDAAAARERLVNATELLRTNPAPLVAWKVYALLGRLDRGAGRNDAAAEALASSAATIRSIADNIRDDAQRALFLASPAVMDVVAAAPG